MFAWALALLVVPLIAGAIGMMSTTGSAVWIGKAFMALFVIIYVAALVYSRKRPPVP